jgi:hypothetical protein
MIRKFPLSASVFALSLAVAGYSPAARELVNQLNAQLVVSGTDPGVHLRMSPTSQEGYYLVEEALTAGGVRKVGVFAVQWADNSLTSGRAQANIHATEVINSVSYDRFLWVGEAGGGQTFFPDSLTENPGKHTIKLRGKLSLGNHAHNPNGGTFSGYQKSVTGGASTAVRDYLGSEGSLCLVSGQYLTKRFTEAVIMNGAGGTPQVLGLYNVELNSPASRSYSVSGNKLYVTLSGGDTYTVYLTCMGGDESTQ